MKRNKCTEKVASQALTPLTDRILTKMGAEGTAIRRRLHHFFRVRRDPGQEPGHEPVKH